MAHGTRDNQVFDRIARAVYEVNDLSGLAALDLALQKMNEPPTVVVDKDGFQRVRNLLADKMRRLNSA